MADQPPESSKESEPPEEPEEPEKPEEPEEPEETLREHHQRYWRANLKILGVLLPIWFLVSFVCGILLVEPLNNYLLPGTSFPLGFWFAQQGSIFTFVILIFVYVWLMGRLDRRFDVDEGEEKEPAK